MGIEYELYKMKIIEDIKKLVLGITLEPDMTKYIDVLRGKCNVLGLDFEFLVEQCKEVKPQKRTYHDIIENTKVEKIENGLRVAFETLLKGEELDTRRLDDGLAIEPYSNGFNINNRVKCRFEMLRVMLISLKDSTVGYKETKDLTSFLEQRNVNLSLGLTKEQLDYIHSLNLNEEDFIKDVDLDLISKKLFTSTNIWGTIDKKGGAADFLYKCNEQYNYRIYMNLHESSDKVDEFLTDYVKMCINKKIPFAMKGHQNKGRSFKDNTVLYIKEENLIDHLEILDCLSMVYSDTVKTFGEPPLLMPKFKSSISSSSNMWFGFSDLGQDVASATYNDRVKFSCTNAFIATMYSLLSYSAKQKLQENGYSVKDLSSLAKFEIQSYVDNLPSGQKRYLVFTHDTNKNLITPLRSDGRLNDSKHYILKNMIALCNEELLQIINTPTKKEEMFEKFKNYFVLFENYFKYNSPRNNNSLKYTFDDYRNLPTTVSISLYEKYLKSLNEKENNKEKLESEIERRR